MSTPYTILLQECSGAFDLDGFETELLHHAISLVHEIDDGLIREPNVDGEYRFVDHDYVRRMVNARSNVCVNAWFGESQDVFCRLEWISRDLFQIWLSMNYYAIYELRVLEELLIERFKRLARENRAVLLLADRNDVSLEYMEWEAFARGEREFHFGSDPPQFVGAGSELAGSIVPFVTGWRREDFLGGTIFYQQLPSELGRP